MTLLTKEDRALVERAREIKARIRREQKASRPKCVQPAAEGQRQPRKRDNGYLAFLRRLPCLHCGATPSDAAHVRMGFLEPGWRYIGKAEKPDDSRAIPLCRTSHTLQHSMAESRFWAEHLGGLHAPALCAELYAAYLAGADATSIILKSRPHEEGTQDNG